MITKSACLKIKNDGNVWQELKASLHYHTFETQHDSTKLGQYVPLELM